MLRCRLQAAMLFTIVGAASAQDRAAAHPERPALSGTGIALRLSEIQRRAAGHVRVVDCHGNYDHTTIQGAIAAAVDGDVVVVLPNTCAADGRYHENLNFLGKAVTVQSLLPADPAVVDATVVDGGEIDRVLTFDQGEGSGSVADGLTLTNGLGGVLCWDSSPIIRNCHITGNHGPGNGGGLALMSSAPEIRNCRITNNSSGNNGGGVSSIFGAPSIADCLISANTAESMGGGLFLLLSSGSGVTNCTLVGNQAGSSGGGLWVRSSAAVVLHSSVVWANPASDGTQVTVESGGVTSSVEVAYSNIQGGPLDIADDGELTWGPGNILVNPSFVDPLNGDYRLSADSPCLDAGDPQTAPDPQAVDVTGSPRLQHCRVDMGAFEGPLFADCDGDQTPDACAIQDGSAADDNGDLRPDVCAIERHVDCSRCPEPGSGTVDDPFCSIQQAIESALPGDHVVVQPSADCSSAVYPEPINFLGLPITVRGTDPDNPDVVVATVIDAGGCPPQGGPGSSTVSFVYGEKHNSVLAGVTVSGGCGTTLPEDDPWAGVSRGGGIFCNGSGPTIQHCRVIDNQADGGGGLAALNGAPLIEDCVFSGNVGRFAGGGVHLFMSSATLRRCRIENNLALGSLGAAYGGGVSLVTAEERDVEIRLQNCVLQANAAAGVDVPGRGGGLGAVQAVGEEGDIDLHINNCLIAGNQAVMGAGASVDSNTSTTIRGSTVSGNAFEYGWGSGLRLAGGPVDIANSIIYGNQRWDLSECGTQCQVMYSNVGAVPESVVLLGDGNISDDPLFADAPAGDYHLSPSSPCINAGDPDFAGDEGERDLDGNDRVRQCRTDMGAYETDLFADCNGNGQSDACELAAGALEDVNANAVPDVCECLSDLNGDGVTDALDLAAVLGAWGPNPGHAANLNGDGTVDAFDLALLVGSWGGCG